MKQLIPLFLSLLLLSAFTGCQRTPSKIRAAYTEAYFHGDLSKAEEVLTSKMSPSLKRGQYTDDADAIWFLMERGTMRLLQNQPDLACVDFNLALQASDYYQQEDFKEQAAKFLLSDEVSAFQGEGYEQIMLRLYFAFALIQSGEEANGLALLRQIQTFSELRQETLRSNKLTQGLEQFNNPLADYLLALFLQAGGDQSNASILYRRAKKSFPPLSKQQAQQLFPKTIDDEQATVLILVHNGNIPYRVSESAMQTEESLMLLNILLTMNDISKPNLTQIPHIPVPALRDWPNGFPCQVQLKINEQSQPLTLALNLRGIAGKELAQALPLIKARAATRYLLREATVASAQSKDHLAGSILDLGMTLANKLTQADTRSWLSLPYTIGLSRCSLPPGSYPLEVMCSFPSSASSYSLPRLKLKKGDLCMIHLFSIHPGVFRYLIPETFLDKEIPNEI